MRVRAALDRLLASQPEVEAAEERRTTAHEGTSAIADVAARHHAVVSGVLRSVTLRPPTDTPALEADLYDGSGTLRLIWSGRREIRGIEPGRRLRAEGRVATVDGRKTMFNPRYELRPRPGE